MVAASLRVYRYNRRVLAMTRSLFVVFLLAVVAALPGVAYAEPLDPTWLGGFWDDDDFDYVVLLVTHLEAALPAAVPVFAATTHVAGAVPAALSDAPLNDRRLPFHRRGPPRV
jgi:hypothetical protein